MMEVGQSSRMEDWVRWEVLGCNTFSQIETISRSRYINLFFRTISITDHLHVDPTCSYGYQVYQPGTSGNRINSHTRTVRISSRQPENRPTTHHVKASIGMYGFPECNNRHPVRRDSILAFVQTTGDRGRPLCSQAAESPHTTRGGRDLSIVACVLYSSHKRCLPNSLSIDLP